MSAIINSLGQLSVALEKLESVAIEQEQRALQIKQQDLFGEGNIDPAVLAKKLDVAIERVEQVLREG